MNRPLTPHSGPLLSEPVLSIEASMQRIPKRRRAFTLVELLVVIGIIAVLISLLLPALSKAKRQAQQVACQSNIRQLGMAFLMFAGDHKGHLPGVQGATGTKEWQADWLGDSQGTGAGFDQDLPAFFASMPEKGTVWPYVKSKGAYLCPGLSEDGVDSGGGSNGRFGYQAFALLSGANIAKLSRPCRPYLEQTFLRIDSYSTVILIEPDAGPDPTYKNINPANAVGINMPGGKTSHHRAYQSIALHHPGGGSVFSIDGSVRSVKRTKAVDMNGAAWQIERRGSSGWPWGDYPQMYYSASGWGAFP